jgi:MYXO-CTERM domain-containing protein
MIRTLLGSAALAAALVSSVSALAADYYFDSVGGDDTNDGKTEATAKKMLKLPTGTGNTVYLKRGSSWDLSLNANNVTVTTYGTGERPLINGSVSVNKSVVQGLKVMPLKGNGINIQSDSTVQDCDVDGTNGVSTNVAIGVMGQNNRIFNNIVRSFHVSQSGPSMDSSGGAEGIMVMASNNEIAWNSGLDLQSPNSTLGGFEGGCYEIVNGKALATISNVSFHHNYCEKSIGLWEGCSGNFSPDGGEIQENHAIIENVTISYNVAVDAMWLFLLQPVNTDFKNVVFAHNTLVHTPKTLEWFDSGHTSMGLAVATYTNGANGKKYDTDNEFYKKGAGFQPGTVIMKNNIFIDAISESKRFMMFSVNLVDHSNNIFVPASAQVGSLTLDSSEQKLDLASLAMTADWRLTAASTPAIDQGATVDMSTNGTLAGTPVDPSFFQNVFNQDYDEHTVPCGAGVDIGASEYCEGAGGAIGPGGMSGAGGVIGSGGAKGSESPEGTGGAEPSGTGGAGDTAPQASSNADGSGGAPGSGSDTGISAAGEDSRGCSCSLGRKDDQRIGPRGFAVLLLLGLLALRRPIDKEQRP